MIEGVRAILYQFLNFMNIKFSKAEEQYDKSSSSLSVRHYFDLMTDIRNPTNQRLKEPGEIMELFPFVLFLLRMQNTESIKNYCEGECPG